jgi:hypothetical protein
MRALSVLTVPDIVRQFPNKGDILDRWSRVGVGCAASEDSAGTSRGFVRIDAGTSNLQDSSTTRGEIGLKARP